MKIVKSQFESNKKLYILRGPSGTGKSTLAETLGAKAVFSADNYFMQGDKYVFNPSKLSSAHGQCQAKTKDALRKGISPVAVDNTFTTRKEITPYMQLAQAYGYTVEFIEPDWDEQLKHPDGTWNVERIAELQKNPDRVKMNKSLNKEIIEKMVNRYQYGLKPEDFLQTE